MINFVPLDGTIINYQIIIKSDNFILLIGERDDF